jgi:hypothetical protein
LPLIRRLRIPALFCGLAVLLCELISRPYTTMGVCDDGPYIFMARTLANTGHFAYNGWATAMIGWQLYLGAAFIKLFGFSFTTVRMSTLLVAVVLAWLLQRTLVLAGISERNATIGTLALVLSPLYLMLSVTFMSEITGLFAVVICLYGCLRALRSSTDRAIIGWLYFSILANALCGTSRQIAWLGILVMVPSALWLLRDRRRVFIAGSVAILAGALFIVACMHWFSLQPYAQPEHLLVNTFPLGRVFWGMLHSLLDIPFILLPIAALFLPTIRRSRPWIIAIVIATILGYLFLALYPSHLRGNFPLEPVMHDWISARGIFDWVFIKGTAPLFFPRALSVLFLVIALGSVLGFIEILIRTRATVNPMSSLSGVSWRQLLVLTVPFGVVNMLLLLPRAATFGVSERYLLEPVVVTLLCLVRFYQDRVRVRLPFATSLLIAGMAILSVSLTYNLFSFYRARVALVDELRANGVPPTSVDNGWEYNVTIELQHADYINDALMVLPPHAYVPTPPPPAGSCSMYFYDKTPHIHPLYGVSFDPDACYGPAPFAPVHFSRWPSHIPGTLYVVRYLPPAKP